MATAHVEIPLTLDQVALVDVEDFNLLGHLKWTAHRNNRGNYTAVRGTGDRKTASLVYMHRVIMTAPPGTYVDHRNGNSLDNRRANLRLATNAENLQNRGKAANNTSGYKGVTLHRHSNLWHVQISANGKRHRLGYYKDKHEAARAYNKAALELHGEYAKINEIETNCK